MLNLVVFNEETTSDLKLHVTSQNQLVKQYLQFALISMENAKFLDCLQKQAAKELLRYDALTRTCIFEFQGDTSVVVIFVLCLGV